MLATKTAGNEHASVAGWIKNGLCIALAVLLLWKGILPAWKTLNTDFPNYYLVARLTREHYSLDRIYDWIWLQRVKDHWGVAQSLVGFQGLTPPSAWPIVPLTFLSPLTAKRIWIVLNLGMLGASVELMHRSTTLRRRFVWLVCLLAVVPLRTSFLFGQMHLLVLLLVTMAWFFYRRRRDVSSGVYIALAAAMKVYPLLLAGYFVVKRRWTAALVTMFAVAVVAALTGALMGQGVLHAFLFQQLPRTMQGDVMDPYNAGFASGASLFHRLLLFEPQLNPSPVLDSPGLYAVLYPLWQMAVALPLLVLLRPWRPSKDRRLEEAEWASVLLALLTLTPVPSTYHFVVMILPAMLLLSSMLRERASKLATLAVLLYTCIGTVNSVRLTALPSARFWLVSALYVLSLLWLRGLGARRGSVADRRDAGVAAALGVCAFAVSVAGYRHHLAERPLQLGDRVQLRVPTLLAASPTPTAGDLYYLAIQREGYRVASQRTGDFVMRSVPAADHLSLANGADGTLLVEAADAHGSRIVRSSDGATVVNDGESPSLSADAQRLVYLREIKGRGTLRLLELSGKNDFELIRNGREEYDVRQAAFAGDDKVLFAAKYKGRVSLFTIAGDGVPNPFFAAEGDIGGFAISPDALHIVFTELLEDRWQLALLDIETGKARTLTHNDCNAYEPTWRAEDEIVYATDCGRGLGLTALAKMQVTP